MENIESEQPKYIPPFKKWMDAGLAPLKENAHTNDQEIARETKEAKDYIFRVVILNRLFETIKDEMRYAGLTEPEIVETEKLLGSREDGVAACEAFLSVPAELRERRYSELAKKVNVGKTEEEKLSMLNSELNRQIDEALEKKMTLGYHITDMDIRPAGPVDNWYWSINGYEYDHRDDRAMAYYSLDHESLFYKRKGKFVYIVRADLGENTTHRMDGNNHWGRAPRLSVVDCFEIADVNKEVDQKVLEATKKPEEDSSGSARAF